MSERFKTVVFLVIGAGSLLVAWAARPAPPTREVVDDRGQLFFAEFTDPLAASTLSIIEFDEETGATRPFVVARHHGVWSIPSHDNYPADAENRFAGAVAQMIGLVKGAAVSDRPADHELYGVADPRDAAPGAAGIGMRVTVSDDAGRALADLIIGSEVRDGKGQRYVRVPALDRVYLCTIDTSKFSTTFDEWIEKDLLQLASSDIAQVIVNDYSIDEFSGRLNQGEELTLNYDSKAFTWSMEGLAESEDLDRTKLNALTRALDDLKIIDVHRKPAGLSSELRAEDTLQLDGEAVQSLRERGFYIVQGRLFSNQGETIVRTKDGVQYTLRFGEVAFTVPGGITDAGEGDEDAEESTGRYLFVTAEFNEDLVPPPQIAELPDLEALIPADDVEPAEGAEPGESARDQAIRMAKEKIDEENRTNQAEHARKLEDGRKKVSELNDRFADWYYVIADSVYGKIRVRRGDVVTAKPQP